MTRQGSMQEPIVEKRIGALRRGLLRWYDRSHRDLPWRRTQDPYAIWVSEIMLQQTRVEVVVAYYERFLERFTNIEQLAAAPLDEVLRLWAGLGYYSRARNLHVAAQQIVRTHGGRFPQEVHEIVALAGIGRYTAGAIGSIAFGQRLPIVDGNVMRVMARFFAQTDCIDTSTARTQFWEWATWWADCRRPGDANQALMELGATVCRPSSPDCGACCVADLCKAHRLDLQEDIPVRSKRRPAQSVALAALLLRQHGRLLLVRRRQGRLLQDFWEMPTMRLPAAGTDKALDMQKVRLALRRYLGLEVNTWMERGKARHSILQHRIQLQVLEGLGCTSARRSFRKAGRSQTQRTRAAKTTQGVASALENLADNIEVRWTTARECRERALTTLTRKALRAAARRDSAWEQYASHPPAQDPTGERRDEPAGNHP